MGGAGGAYGGAYGAGRGAVVVAGNNGNCCVAQGEDCTACGVGCGGGGQGALAYVGTGQGEYIQETTYKYVGCGGDFDAVRPRRDFTCLVTVCCLLSLLLLIPLLCWLCSGPSYDCTTGALNWETSWSLAQQQYCCSSVGVGCPKAILLHYAGHTPPPTPPPTP